MMAHKNKVVGELTKGVEFLFKKNKVVGIVGEGKITAPGKVSVKTKDGVRELEAKNIVIATGSDVATLPGDRDRRAPDRVVDRRAVVSGGAEAPARDRRGRDRARAGLGVAAAWAPRCWWSNSSTASCRASTARSRRQFQRLLERQGMKFKLASKVVGVEKKGAVLVASIEPAAGGARETVEADAILVAIGRRAYTDGLGLDEVGVARDKRGRVVTDEHFKTNVPGIWAIGDVREGAMLAHKAEDEAVACAEIIAGRAGHVNYDAIPSVIYTYPEVATVGKTEEELKAAGIAYKVGKFPFTANARAKTNITTEGFVKIIADAKTDRVLGVHMIGPDVGNMIGEASLAIEFSASVRRHRAHQPRASDADRSRAPGRHGRRRLDDADVKKERPRRSGAFRTSHPV